MAELPAFWPTRRRWLGLAGRHGQRRAPADGADVAANLPGLVRVKSVRRLPPGGRDPLAGVGGLGREKKLWRVVVGRARCGHGGYLVDPRRGHEVPQSHLGIEASGVLEVDRYSGYKARRPVKNGSLQCALGAWATRLCGRGQSTRGHPALPPLERVRRTSRGARSPGLGSLRAQHLLTPLAERSAFGMRARTFSIPGEAPPWVPSRADGLAEGLRGIEGTSFFG